MDLEKILNKCDQINEWNIRSFCDLSFSFFYNPMMLWIDEIQVKIEGNPLTNIT